MSQAEPVRISSTVSDLANLHDALLSVIEELEEWEGVESKDGDTRRFWHAHGQLSGCIDTLAAWLGPLLDGADDSLAEQVAGLGGHGAGNASS